MLQKDKSQIDMTAEGILGKILLFSIPLMLSGILQLFYNAADIIVVGRFAGENALAAVGSTSSLNNLLVNLFLGLSVGSNVIAARTYGAKDYEAFSRNLHTSVVVSVIAGLFAMAFGLIFIEDILNAMETPNDVIDLAAKYMRIVFIGMPAQMLYNFGAAILRAIGDTKKPLYILAFSGLVNVILNLTLVIFFKMDVDGVAIGTIVSQYISAFLVAICLKKLNNLPQLSFKKLKIYKNELLSMLKIGVPAGINSSLFSFSNVIIQSAVNSFNSSVIVAGNSVGSSLEGFVYTAINSFHHSALTYTEQNLGAKKYNRLTKGIFTCIGCVTVVGIVTGLTMLYFGEPLSSLYNTNAEVIRYAVYRMSFILPTYFLCGIMDVINGSLRGLGHSMRPMLISIITVCVLRIIFVIYIFPHFRDLALLYISWPVSWLLSIVCQAILLIYFIKKLGHGDSDLIKQN